MERKDLEFSIKNFKQDDRILTGYASTFGLPFDSAGDVINKGAFAKTILNVKKNGIPLLDSHKQESSHVLGTVVDAFEDDHGLFIKAVLADTPGVDEVRSKLMQGHINKMSIGFFIEQFEMREVNGDLVRFIGEADLMEVSVVAIPANNRADIVSVKNRDTAVKVNTQEDVAKKESTSFCEKQYLNTLFNMIESKLNHKQGDY